jgi:GNAT superfamily N-acetyltransferase
VPRSKSKPPVQHFRLRTLTKDDFADIVELQKKCFPGMTPSTQDQFDSQVDLFREGQLCIEEGGRVVASASSLIVEFDLYSDWHDWTKISDGGMILNHDPEGDTLYGIEIMVDPEFRGKQLARRLYDARKELCREKNLMRMVIGGRIPGYQRRKRQMTAAQYVEKVKLNEIIDPVLTTQLRNGFVLQRLIPDYLPSDEDSAGFATHMEWTNLAYVENERRRLSPVQTVRVAAVQYEMRRIETFDEFARQCEFFVDAASDYRCDFVVFPELFTLQLLSLMRAKKPGDAARSLARLTPRYLELFTGLSVKYGVNIVGSANNTSSTSRQANAAGGASTAAASSRCSSRTAVVSPSTSATTSSSPSSLGSRRARAPRSCSARTTPTAVRRICACATAHSRAASKTTYTW